MNPSAQNKNTTECIAIYTLGVYKQVSLLIPKRKGLGYLKAPFGGHHGNDCYSKWLTENPELFGRSCCDLDSYLSIDIYKNKNDKGFEELFVKFKQALINVFPHITSFKEVDINTFFNIVNKNK